LAKRSLIRFVDDVDNPWILSISTGIYLLSMDIYPDASGCIHGSPHFGLPIDLWVVVEKPVIPQDYALLA
jgi:hypothetical protein